MKALRAATLALVLATSLGAAPQPGAACPPLGQIHFICGVTSPEDLAVLPGERWVIASGDREGGRIHLVDVRAKTATLLFPAADRRETLDAAAYPSCPGPIDPKEGNEFRAHGLYLKRGSGSTHALYVVHHGFRESVEVFQVMMAGARPTLGWIGCAVAPKGLVLNAVVALPEGGFATTSTQTHDIWEWHASTGWAQVPGSDDTAPNGIEISGDGQWFYVAGWAEEKFTRLSRGRTPVQKDVIKLGFRPDNVRMALDHSVIFAAGHGNVQNPRVFAQETSNVSAIDLKTLKATRIFQHADIEGFGGCTTAIRIGREMWLGSYRGEKIAYFPAPGM